jgi:hypothetical protein
LYKSNKSGSSSTIKMCCTEDWVGNMVSSSEKIIKMGVRVRD